MLTKAVFSGSHDGLRNSAYLFFFLCSSFSFVALLLYVFIMLPHPLVQKCSENACSDAVCGSSKDQEALIDIPATRNEATCLSTFLKIKRETIILSITFMVYVYLSPGVVVDAKVSAKHSTLSQECESSGRQWATGLI